MIPELDATVNKVKQLESDCNKLVEQLNTIVPAVHQELTSKINPVKDKIQEWEDKVKNMERARAGGATGAGTGPDGYKKGITEYKIINTLCKLGNDRKEFKAWQEKMEKGKHQDEKLPWI